MTRIVLLFSLFCALPLAAADKVNNPYLVNADACECKVEGPEEVCLVGETITLDISLVKGKAKAKKFKVEIKGNSDAEWSAKGGGKSFDINLPCDGSRSVEAQLWTGTKIDTTIEIWIGKAKCKTIKVVKCPSETITAESSQCSDGQYGGVFRYSYTCAKGWWFREEVGTPTGTCGETGDLEQQKEPVHMGDGVSSYLDRILNEGSPGSFAHGCIDSNPQTVFIGPTAEECRKGFCSYQHTHVIVVVASPTATSGAVITTVNGTTTDCTFSRQP